MLGNLNAYVTTCGLFPSLPRILPPVPVHHEFMEDDILIVAPSHDFRTLLGICSLLAIIPFYPYSGTDWDMNQTLYYYFHKHTDYSRSYCNFKQLEGVYREHRMHPRAEFGNWSLWEIAPHCLAVSLSNHSPFCPLLVPQSHPFLTGSSWVLPNQCS